MSRPRAALVSGASTGIGAATAQRLTAAGWAVWAGVRDDAAVERLGSLEGVRPVYLDVTDQDSVLTAMAEVRACRGDDGLDLLVNNAGIVRGGPLEFLDMAEWEHQFDVNFFGTVRLTRAALPLLRRAVDPRIILVGSIAGRIAGPLVGPYAASKHALAGLAGSLRRELGRGGPHVTLLEPGAVVTPLWGKAAMTAAQIDAQLPADGRALYGGLVDRQRRLLGDGDHRGIEADRVARVIESCADRRYPPARRLVGLDARIGGLAARFLPESVLDAVLSRGGSPSDSAS